MDHEGERDLAVANIQRFAWRHFRSELLRAGEPPSYAALREYLRGFEGTRMLGPLFDAARMGPTPFDLEASLSKWYAEWAGGRYLEPIESRIYASRKVPRNEPDGHSNKPSGRSMKKRHRKRIMEEELTKRTEESPEYDSGFDETLDEMLDDEGGETMDGSPGSTSDTEAPGDSVDPLSALAACSNVGNTYLEIHARVFPTFLTHVLHFFRLVQPPDWAQMEMQLTLLQSLSMDAWTDMILCAGAERSPRFQAAAIHAGSVFESITKLLAIVKHVRAYGTSRLPETLRLDYEAAREQGFKTAQTIQAVYRRK